jgi:hypothetical protein
MALPIFEAHPATDFFEPAREALLETYRIRPPPASHLPRIIYIDRQKTDRRLPNQTHDALMDLFVVYVELGKIQFDQAVLEDLTSHQQIEAVAYADVRPTASVLTPV